MLRFLSFWQSIKKTRAPFSNGKKAIQFFHFDVVIISFFPFFSDKVYFFFFFLLVLIDVLLNVALQAVFLILSL
jgi:hypothetical protein